MASNMYTMINIRFNKYYIHLHNKSPGNVINSPSILVICAQYYAAFNEE